MSHLDVDTRTTGAEASGEGGGNDDNPLTTDPPSNVHMTCVYQHGYVGCAWYDVDTGEVLPHGDTYLVWRTVKYLFLTIPTS